MSIKIKFPQQELRKRVAHLLQIDVSYVLFVTPTLGGKSFIASVKLYNYRSQETTKTFTIWEIVNCLPMTDIEAQEISFKDLIQELKESLTLMDLSEYPKDLKKLKTAYRQKAKKCHPDHGGNSDLFRKVKIAYEILKRHHGTFFVQN